MKSGVNRFTGKLFMRFFIPALFSSLGLAIGAAVDCLYIGRMLNEAGLYIIGVTSPIYMIFTTWSVALAVGGTIHYAKVMGEGDETQGKKIFCSTIIGDFIGVCLLSIIGLILIEPLLALLGVAADGIYYSETLKYVRWMLVCCPIMFMQAPLQYFVHSDDNPKLASVALVAGCIFDCASGYLLIVVIDAGVTGSIWSTVIGAIVMELICLTHFFSTKGNLRFGKLVFSIKTLFASFKTGFATAAQYLYQFVILLVFNHILLNIGGEVSVAIYDISVNVMSLVIAVIDAVVLSMLPMISTFFGERNREGIKSCLKLSLVVGVVSTVVMSGFLMIIAPMLNEVFELPGDAVSKVAFAVRMVLLSGIIACINKVLAAYFQNIGSEGMAYVMVVARELVILLLCGLLFAGGGYHAFWFSYIVTELVVFAGIGIVIIYKKLVKKQDILKFEEGAVFAETFVGSCEKISETCERLQSFLEEEGASHKKAYFVTLAVDEVCRLIAKNTGDLTLQITLLGMEDEYVLHIRDNAGKFNPFDIREEDEDDERTVALKIIKKQTKEYYYRQYVGFNTLTMSIAKEG